MAYLHFYGRRNNITRARINYILRDNGAGPFVYEVIYDPSKGEKIEAELHHLRNMITLGVIPDIPNGYQIGKFPCSWSSKNGGGHCQYFGHCWPQG